MGIRTAANVLVEQINEAELSRKERETQIRARYGKPLQKNATINVGSSNRIDDTSSEIKSEAEIKSEFEANVVLDYDASASESIKAEQAEVITPKLEYDASLGINETNCRWDKTLTNTYRIAEHTGEENFRAEPYEQKTTSDEESTGTETRKREDKMEDQQPTSERPRQTNDSPISRHSTATSSRTSKTSVEDETSKGAMKKKHSRASQSERDEERRLQNRIAEIQAKRMKLTNRRKRIIELRNFLGTLEDNTSQSSESEEE